MSLSRFSSSAIAADKERITYGTVSGTELITSDKFEAALGHAWIRLRIVYDNTRTVEFTVSAP